MGMRVSGTGSHAAMAALQAQRQKSALEEPSSNKAAKVAPMAAVQSSIEQLISTEMKALSPDSTFSLSA